MLRKTPTATLMTVGLLGIALRGVILIVMEPSSPMEDAADFGLSLLFGVSATLLLMAAWRRGRARMENPWRFGPRS